LLGFSSTRSYWGGEVRLGEGGADRREGEEERRREERRAGGSLGKEE
jgi:hypothetical protein